jgi:hypothetical protein
MGLKNIALRLPSMASPVYLFHENQSISSKVIWGAHKETGDLMNHLSLESRLRTHFIHY